MPGSAAGTGLSGVSWVAVAAGVAVAAVSGAYVSGMFDPFLTQDPATVAAPEDPAQDPTKQVAPATSAGDAPTDAAQSAPESDADSDADSDTAAVASGGTPQQPAQTGDQLAPTATIAPSIDLIRVEPDGTTVIAGKSTPGSTVILRLDEDALAEQITADANGDFVGFLTLSASDHPRVLTVETANGVDSGEQLIIAPTQTVIAGAPQDPVETAGAEDKPQAFDPAVSVKQPQTGHNPAEGAAEVAENSSAAAEASPQSTATKPAPEATQQVAILRSGEDGVELVQPATGAARALALDTIGYSETGDVQLSGRAPKGATIRVYLDNAATQDFATNTEGRWTGSLTGIAPGIYTLRLDALDGAGKVLSRLETPFKREAPEVLNPKPTTAQPDSKIASEPAIRAVTVQKGDTLWAISRDRYGDGVLYVKLFEANKLSIRDPNLIYPGQVFEIPQE